MLKPISLENMASHLQAMGYDAKAKSFVRNSGELADIVEINGLGSINAYFEQNPVDPAKSGLKVFGNLQPGYAPVLTDDDGNTIRERIVVNGKPEWGNKRGTPLDDEALKKKNNQIAMKAREQLSGAVVAAYLIEANGGDLDSVKNAFRLQKYERPTGPSAKADSDTPEAAVAPIAPKASATPGATF